MGVKGLYSYLKHYRNHIDLDHLPLEVGPLRIGIDAMSILYRMKGNTGEIIGLIKGLKSHGHRILFVFDGKPPAEKEREIQSRRDAKESAAAHAIALESFLKTDEAATMSIRDREILQTTLARAKTEAWHMTRDLRKAFQELLWTEQIPYVKSVSEADDVLIDLINGGKLDVIMSSDMDYLLGGTPRLWIPTNKATNYFEEVLLADVLDGEGFSAAAFLDGCLLCGTEEREGAKGVPPHIAFGWIRHYGSLEGLLKSNITDTTFRKMFPTVEAIAVARATVVAQEPYSRIRSDHLERVREFIDGL